MRFLAILFFTVHSFIFIGQENEPTNNLLLDGFLKIESDKPLPTQKIEIKSESGEVLESIYTDNTGRFKAYFPFDVVQELWCSKSGYHTKVLVVDTRNVSPAEKEWGYEYGGFNVVLNPIGLENHTINRVVKFYYSANVQNFEIEALVE